jgi:PPP family 3-phenylpropionic acid transporter
MLSSGAAILPDGGMVPMRFVAPRLSAFYFAYFAYIGVSAPYFPVYLSARGFHAAEIATVLALPGIARIFAPALWGWLADRTGAKRGIVIFSCAAMVCAFAALPVAPGVTAVAALIALMSVLSAGAMPLVEAITLSSLAGASGRYGRIRLWGSIGFIAAVLAAGAWLDVRPALTVSTWLVVLASFALAAAVVLPAGSRKPPASAGAPRTFARSPEVKALLGAGFCMAVAHGALYAFYTLHLQRAGYPSAVIGALWTLGVLAEIVVFLFLPAVFRRFALSAVLLASFIAAALRFAAIGWAGASLPILVLAQLLHGLTFGAHHAASVAVVHHVFPESAHARGQSLYTSVSYGAGGAVGILLAGWAWEAGGPALAFSLSALAGLAGAGFVMRLRRARL